MRQYPSKEEISYPHPISPVQRCLERFTRARLNPIAPNTSKVEFKPITKSKTYGSPVFMYIDASDKKTVSAWSVVLVCGDKKKQLSGISSDATFNRMYLQAAIEGFKALKSKSIVHLITSSDYVLNGCTKSEHGTINARGYTANKDLWLILESLMSLHEVTCAMPTPSHRQHVRKVKRLVKEAFYVR
jgi:ribonuclease HI